MQDSDAQVPVGGDVPADEAAFRRRYEELAAALHAWASIRIRPEVRAWVDPQDLVQEVWCRAWRQRAAAPSATGPFRAWLFRFAKNVLLEAFRKARSPAFRAGAMGTTTRLLVLEGVPDDVTAVSLRLARDEGLSRLAGWVDGLDEDERLLVVHCGLEGLPFAEVGTRLGLSRDAVAKRWQRLRERLAEQRLPRELFAQAG